MALRKRVKKEPEVIDLSAEESVENELTKWKPKAHKSMDVRISVSEELKDHYDKIIEKRNEILEDNRSEDQSVIGILNATTSIIRELSKIQESLYNSERYARFQQIVIGVIDDQDIELATKIVEALDNLRFDK